MVVRGVACGAVAEAASVAEGDLQGMLMGREDGSESIPDGAAALGGAEDEETQWLCERGAESPGDCAG